MVVGRPPESARARGGGSSFRVSERSNSLREVGNPRSRSNSQAQLVKISARKQDPRFASYTSQGDFGYLWSRVIGFSFGFWHVCFPRVLV
ncbi:hypothetical protein NL676_000504 [Syzygium grande]|nr:hypothetical protein NL676_000504 [Syzygium grande]